MNIFKAIKRQIAAFGKNNSPLTLLNEPIDDSLISQEDIRSAMEVFGLQLLTDINSDYKMFLESKNLSEFHFIKENGINGFAIDCYRYDLTIEDWRCLQIFCLNQLKEIKYILHVNQVSTKSRQQNLITTYKYYLKPSLKLMTEIPSEQLFGNMTLELILQNSKPFRFLLHANYYSDRNYKNEKKFQLLLNFLEKG